MFGAGAASALALYAVFQTRGVWLGTARVGHRIWHHYWRHIAAFLVAFSALIVVDRQLGGVALESRAALDAFLAEPGARLRHVLTLSYAPDIFDAAGAAPGFAILPTLIVALALTPIVFLMARIRPWLALACCAALWALASQPWRPFLETPAIAWLEPPGDPGTDRSWPLNPFAWQLLFFAGAAFALGWLPRPRVDRRLIWAAGAVLLICAPLAFATAPAREQLAGWSGLEALASERTLGLLRLSHFLALAYLAWIAAGDAGGNLPKVGWSGRVVAAIRRIGAHSIGLLALSLAIAPVLGVLLVEASDSAGPLLAAALANGLGVGALLAAASIAQFYKTPPWKSAPPAARGAKVAS